MKPFVMRLVRKRSDRALATLGAALVVVASLFFAASASDAHASRVLVLHSYHQGLPWTDGFQTGISSVLSRSRKNIELDVHYLDAARLGGAVSKAQIKSLIEGHIAHAPQDRKGYDVVITTDNDALDMVLRHRESFAPGVPIVFCGINNFSPSIISGHKDVTGVAEKLSISDTLELAARLRPQTGKVLVLAEDSTTGRQNAELLATQARSVSWHPHIEFMREKDIVVLEKRLAGLTPDWMVFLMCWPFEGDHMLTVVEASERLTRAAPVPVFSGWDFWVGHGILGGKVVSSKTQGETAAAMALRILEGEPVSAIPVLEESPNVLLLDHNVLERFAIPGRLVPAGASVLNYTPSFYEQYRSLVWGYGLLSLFGTSLCLLLAFNVVRRRRAEASLVRQLSFNESLMRAMPTPVFYKDAAGRYLGCNQAFAEFFGLAETELVGKTSADVFPGQDSAVFESKDREIHHRGGVQIYEHSMTTPRGERKVTIRKALFADGVGRPGGIIGVLTDITDRKKMEEEIVAARDAALSASEAKSSFLANMSHEIRTPLNGILGMLQLLDAASLTEEQKTFAQMAIASTNRLTELLSDILDISRIEAGKLSISRRPFELDGLLASVRTLFAAPAREKGLDLRVSSSPGVPPALVGDDLRLRQILFNLVGNAIKFTSSGFVALDICLLPGHGDGGCRLLFCVGDSGPGISDEMLPRVFEPFAQGEKDYVRNHQGAGLGLAIVSQLARMMDGNLSVDNSDTGATICFSMQFGIPRGAVEVMEKDESSRTMPRALRILLAEDDAVSMFAARKILEKEGHAVSAAFNGREALDILREGEFDLVIMDVQMPVMDGLQATALIRGDGTLGAKARIPVIAMTAYAMRGDREKFIEAGLDGYVAKPLDRKTLCETIASVLGAAGKPGRGGDVRERYEKF